MSLSTLRRLAESVMFDELARAVSCVSKAIVV